METIYNHCPDHWKTTTYPNQKKNNINVYIYIKVTEKRKELSKNLEVSEIAEEERCRWSEAGKGIWEPLWVTPLPTPPSDWKLGSFAFFCFGLVFLGWTYCFQSPHEFSHYGTNGLSICNKWPFFILQFNKLAFFFLFWSFKRNGRL